MWAIALIGALVIPAQVLAPSGAAAVIGIAAVMVVLRYVTLGRIPAVQRNAIVAAVVLILFWAAVSALWSVAPRMPLKQTGVMVALTVVCAAAGQVGGERHTAVWKWIIAGLGIGFFMIAIELEFDGVLNGGLAALTGSEKGWRAPRLNRAIALSLLLLWPAMWYLRRTGRTLMGLGFFVLAVVIVVFSPSASIKIAFVAGTVIWGAVRFWGRPVVHVFTGAAILILLLAPVWVSSVVTPDRLHSTMPNIGMSALHRTFMWEFAVDRTLDRPVLGWGFDSSRRLPGGDIAIQSDFFRTARPEPVMGTHPHNWPVQIWVELGGIGALLFAGLLAAVGRTIATWDSDRGRQAAMAACLGFAFVLVNLMWGIWQSWWLASLGLPFLLFPVFSRLTDEEPRPFQAGP